MQGCTRKIQACNPSYPSPCVQGLHYACYIWNETALMRNIRMYTTTGRGWNYKEANSNYKQGKPPVIKLQMRLSMEAMKELYEIRNCRFVLSQVLWSSTRHICAKKFPRRHTERRGIWVQLHLTEQLTSNWTALILCMIKQPTYPTFSTEKLVFIFSTKLI